MTDLLTAEEGRLALGRGAQDSSKQSLLSVAITAASAKLVESVGPVVYGTVTAELHDGGGNVIYLDQRPVASITQIVEYDFTTAATLTAESNSAKGTAAYVLADAKSGRLIRRNSNQDAFYPAGRANVSVSYVAGRCQATLVPERYKLATALILKNVWRAWESSVTTLGEYDVPQATFPSFSMPKAVRELLADEWQAGSGVGE